ncbi:MAG TPA: ABC transporter substrate-binding protein [Candidatus Limnocylindria bacterium]|nr:ABC transporter substrate-binding protein [Candidatus Limnocylindria bacterium]
MFDTIKRLALGVFLIALAAGVLLYTDRGSRNRVAQSLIGGGGNQKVYRVALVEHASIPALEQGVNGVIEALASRGYTDGGKIELKRYNAEADIGTANTIAKEVTSGGYDLIVSVSTTSLQTVANANKTGRHTPHVFGLASDPYGAGVGIERTNHAIHPPYMTGYGCMQPVANSFKTAREMRPSLKTVGLVWNPAEANSQAQTKIARAVCAEMGIDLVEANAENSTAALEAVNSLIPRNVEAIWISGDVTISLATDTIISVARRAKIPVFTVMPPNVRKGALFDLGADYVEVGRTVGLLAADVLDGKNPADVPVENYVPEMFLINDTVLAGLRDTWTISPALRQRAGGWITATSTNLPNMTVMAPKISRPAPGRTYKIGLAFFAPEPGAEICMKGIFDGLKELGFEEGKNLEVRRSHAQGEIVNIPSMLQNFDGSDVDLVLPMTTPVISGACGFVKHKPVVFTYCSDPVAAGAGKSFTNHLPFVTGVGSFPPVQDMVDLIHRTMPQTKTVGTIYNAAEANSVKVVEVARELFAKAGIKLDEVTVASSSEVLQAAQALVSRKVEAVYIQGDNTVTQGFDAVVKSTRDAKIPLFVDDPDAAKRGAVACVGLGFYRPGYAAAKSIARVLLGESPGSIPMENVAEKALWLDLDLAQKLGLKFPVDVIDQAAKEQAKSAKTTSTSGGPFKPLSRKMRVDLIEYLETPNVEIAREGVLAGFKKVGLEIGKDIDLRVRNAQGDMATLNTIVDASVSERVDLMLASATPALQGALRRGQGKPLIFTLIANPILAGAGKSDDDHLPFVTGSYIPAPHEEGLAALLRCLPRTKRIGTLYVPAEVNSVFYKDQLLIAAKAVGLEVELVGVSTSSEVSDAALALCGRNIDVFCQISDNTTGASFASVVQAAKRARIPLMGFAAGQAKSGAFMTVSRDYFDGGVVSAEMAARVLRGEDPARIPFKLVEQIKYTFNPTAAAQFGIVIPPDVLAKGEIVR